MGASGNLGATTTAILKNTHAAKQSNVKYKNTLIQTAIFIVFISIQYPFILPSAALFCGARKPLLETMKLFSMFINPFGRLGVHPSTSLIFSPEPVEGLRVDPPNQGPELRKNVILKLEWNPPAPTTSMPYATSVNSGRYLATPERPSLCFSSSTKTINASSDTAHSLRIPYRFAGSKPNRG
jgi:hypothetical protein